MQLGGRTSTIRIDPHDGTDLDTAPTRTQAGPGEGGPRRVRRPRPLPTGRAVVGGLLVALAMLASFAVAAGRDHGPRGRVVVVRHAVRFGSRIGRDNARTVRVDLPDSVARRTFASVAEVEGSVALSDLAPGDVVQRSSVSFTADPPDRELSFPVDRARALDGRLQPGETVDLLATYGTGEAARTVVVARQVRLVDTDDARQGLESTGKLIVTIALHDPDEVLAATHASGVAAITLVRSTGSTGEGSDSYSVPLDKSRDPVGSSGAASGSTASTPSN
jgi:Flp pilus assembly protein CpaB